MKCYNLFKKLIMYTRSAIQAPNIPPKISLQHPTPAQYSNTTILRPNIHKIKPPTFPLSPNSPLQPKPPSSRNAHQHLQPDQDPQQHESG